MYGGTYLCRGLWLRFYYLGKRENDFTILAGREYDFYERVYVDSSSLSENQKIDIRNAVRNACCLHIIGILVVKTALRAKGASSFCIINTKRAIIILIF